jgi:hypothetical protein
MTTMAALVLGTVSELSFMETPDGWQREAV